MEGRGVGVGEELKGSQEHIHEIFGVEFLGSAIVYRFLV